MRVGMLIRADRPQLEQARRLGFRSIEWVGFENSPALGTDGQAFAAQFAAEACSQGIRISAIGALYRNPLDPKQTESARLTFQRAIEVAAKLGVKTVAGFAGGVIETEFSERAGAMVYKSFE